MDINNDTIFYSIMYQSNDAISIIPQLALAYALTPHRVDKSGEIIEIPVNRTLGQIKFAGGTDWIHPEVTIDKIKITFDKNETGEVRICKPVIQYCDPTGCKTLIQFALHLN